MGSKSKLRDDPADEGPNELTEAERSAADHDPLIPEATGAGDVAYKIQCSSRLSHSVHKEWDPPLHHQVSSRLSIAERLSVGDIERLSTRMLVKPEGPTVPDIFGWTTGPYLVSQAVRQLIEELEPNTHDFYPVEMVLKKRRAVLDSDYFLAFIPVTIDSVIKDKTNIRKRVSKYSGIEIVSYTIDSWRGPVVLDRKTISGRHLWRNEEPLASNIFCSVEFANRVRKAGFKGWEFRPCHVTDR